MSHSVVKVTQAPVDDSVVIVVGEDGSVSLDRETLERMLSGNDAPTELNVVRVNQGEGANLDLTVDRIDVQPDAMDELISCTDEATRNYNSFLKDHDYTPLTSPDQLKTAQEIDSELGMDELAQTLSMLEGSDGGGGGNDKTSAQIKLRQQVKPVQKMKILNRDSTKMMTLNKANSRNGRKVMTRIPPPKVVPKKAVPNKVVQRHKFVPAAVPDGEESEEEDSFDLEDESDSDDNSDLDFEEVISRARATKRTYGKRSKTETSTPVQVKRTLSKSPRSKIPKLPPPPPVSTQISVLRQQQQLQEVKLVESEVPKTPEAKKPTPKKEKKTPKPILDDGIALFSTPDIIRRVGSKHDTLSSGESPPKMAKPAKIGQDGRTRSNSDRTSTDRIKTGFRHSLDSKGLYSRHPSTETKERLLQKPKEVKILNNSQSTIVEPMLEESGSNEDESLMDTLEPMPSAEDIRAIIHTESTKTFTSSLVLSDAPQTGGMMPNVPAAPPSVADAATSLPMVQPHEQQQIASMMTGDMRHESDGTLDPGHMSLETAGLEIDQAILDNISTEELISEDILYQVAKLVENTDIQTVIDRSFTAAGIVLDPPNLNSQINRTPSTVHTHELSEQATLNVPSSLSQVLTDQGIKTPTANATATTPMGIREIVRPDGRVLILPPIAKPVTRSSKKKFSDDEQPPTHTQTSPIQPSQPIVEDAPILIKEMIMPPVGLTLPADDDGDSDSDESWNSEDDPDRLWCICKQPHNNRFMICCDTCEDWFHGKCVNVTKAMGQQMEEEGREWICPNCIKKKTDPEGEEKVPVPLVTPAQRNKRSRSSTDMNKTTFRRQSTEVASQACIVCGNPSRSSSVYCSDQCILKHAQGVERVVVFERATGKILSGSNAPSAANAKQWLLQHPGFELVRTASNKVFKRVTQSKLKLVKNTGGEGVSLAVQRKGVPVGILRHTPKGQQIIRKGQKIQGLQVITKHIPGTIGKIKLIQPVPFQKSVMPGQTTTATTTMTTATNVPTKVRITQSSIKSFASPKSIEKQLPPKIIKPVKTETTPVKDQVQDQENIRESVRKTLLEHLNVRLKLSPDITLAPDEVSKLVTEIELQLYKLFGDTGPKYRAKYRSLTFNIKDPKNQTLWRRICEKSIVPTQLVRLSPDDLASQELALWRERETKHQLEMIKKSELELLQCNRTYVLKTHKGEEVMEERRPTSTVDSTEVVATLGADSTLTENSESADSKQETSERRSRSSERKSSKHSRRDRDKHRRSSRDRDTKDRKRERRSSSKERHKRSGSRDKSSHHDKKRDSRDRDRHRRASHKSSRHKKDNYNGTEKLDKKSKEILEQLVDKQIVPPLEDRLWKHVQHEDVVPTGNAIESDSDHEPTSTVTIPTPPRSTELEEKAEQKRLTVEPKIVEKPVVFDEAEEIVTKVPSNPEPMKMEGIEPVSPPPPPPPPPKPDVVQVWKGTINMVDVAQISITAQLISGECTSLTTDLQPNLDIVGRISPDTVWDYISKMRCSNSKTISILRLNATNMEEKMPYIALYSYLCSRSRLGVVKTNNKSVKDFYILPLPSKTPIPPALLPLTGPGFEEPRPPLLIGIIVRTKRKRAIPDLSSIPSKRSKGDGSISTPPSVSAPNRSYTPPPTTTTTRVDPRIKVSVVVTTPEPTTPDDDDEPYSPEDSDVEALPPSAIPSKAAELHHTLTNLDLSSVLKATTSFLDGSLAAQTFEPFNNKFDSIPGLGEESAEASSRELQRKMAELDKCIELHKQEIRNMSQDIVSTATPTDLGTSALANIALPSNLQQILDSIKGISPASTDATEEYSPLAPSFSKTEDLTIPLLLPKISSRTSKSSSIPLQLPPVQKLPSVELPTNIILPDVSVPPPNLIVSSPTIPLNLPKTSKAPAKPVPLPVIETVQPEPKPVSVLSTLSEEELIRKAAEMLGETETVPAPIDDIPPPPVLTSGNGASVNFNANAPPISFSPPPTLSKRAKIDLNQPPIPGLEDF